MTIQAMLEDAQKENLDLARRVREVIFDLPYTKADLAEMLGVTPQAITGWERTGRIGKKSLSGLSAISGYSVHYFLTGEVAAAEEQTWADVKGYSQAVGLGAGTEALEYAETHKLKFRADSLARKRLNPEKLAVMYGSGDSMLPRILPGDAILFDTSDTRPRDGMLYVILVSGAANPEYQVKRCMVLEDDIYFVADNPAGDHNWRKPKRIDSKKHPIEIIGRVRWIGSWED